MILDTLATYITDLLTFDETLVVIGRENALEESSSKNYIVIDELVSIPDARQSSFDGDTEVQELTEVNKGDFTIDFHGDDARQNAINFKLLQRSQAGYELQRDLEISVFNASSMIDVKKLQGSQYGSRYQIEIKVQYNEVVAVDTLRIDTAQTSFIVNL